MNKIEAWSNADRQEWYGLQDEVIKDLIEKDNQIEELKHALYVVISHLEQKE